MLFDDLGSLLRVLAVTPLAYVWLVAVLRVTGKRTLAQLNAFDFIVTVALGSTLATITLSGTVSWSEGALALALLALLQLGVAWLSVRVPAVRRFITSEPSILLRAGQMDHEAMRRERISEQSLRQAVRSAGQGGLEAIAYVVLETNGKLSVVSVSSLGSGSAMTDLVDDVG